MPTATTACVNVLSSLSRRAAVVALSFFATACVSHQHVVGLGPSGAGEQSARQYYVLFGLLQVNGVESQRLAGDLTSYSIDTRFGWWDLLLAPFLAPLTATSRTVTVRT